MGLFVIAITSTVGGITATTKESSLTMTTDGDVTLNTTGGTGDVIAITNSPGTANDAIAITSTVGGITATTKSSSLTMKTDGDVTLNTDGSDNDVMTISNTKGTTANAIAITASAGGVTIVGASSGVSIETVV